MLNISAEYDAEYYKALARNRDVGRTRGIDATLTAHQLDALVLPTGPQGTTIAALGMSHASFWDAVLFISYMLSRIPHRNRSARLLSGR
jgi:hypothetical protein